MSLFSSIQVANNTLLASQIGLQVAGNNIANANTPGYIRQEAVLTPGPTQRVGDLPLGLGVRVEGIVQKVDRFLGERLRGAVSDLKNSETQEDFFLQLEAMIGELGDADLSSSLGRFFASVNDVLNQPEDLSLRNLALLQGDTLLSDMRRLDGRARQLYSNINQDITGAAADINRVVKEIAALNVKVVGMEGGTSSSSQAVGLRDQREQALTKLAELLAIRVVEQDSGAVTVFAGGDFLVFEGATREVVPHYETQEGMAAPVLHLADSDSRLQVSGGRLAGLYAARDEILGSFLDDLGQFASTLAFEFNKLFSGGQGLTGYQQITSQHSLSDPKAALDQAGLSFTPVNGSFQLHVRNRHSGLVEVSDVFVDLDGLDEDTSLIDLAATLNAIDGVSAEVTSDQKLQIRADSSELEFAFANDTSGVLAALGLNVLFVGSTPRDLALSSVMRSDPSKFAVSLGGIGADADNAARLAGFADRALQAHDGRSLSTLYESMISRVTQASAVTQSITNGFRVFQRTLEGQHMSISGVSIDDEAIQIISYQRMYQASARLIAAVDELLNFLVNL